jgi:hypothetical protein
MSLSRRYSSVCQPSAVTEPVRLRATVPRGETNASKRCPERIPRRAEYSRCRIVGHWLGIEGKQTQNPIFAGMHTRIGSITMTFTVTAILQ